jgi:hypothetical protein
MSDDGAAKASGGCCGGIISILSTVFFIYLMVAYGNVDSIKSTAGYPVEYIHMIDWIKGISIAEFAYLGVAVFFLILGCIGFCCGDRDNCSGMFALVLFVVYLFGGLGINIAFVALGREPKESAGSICSEQGTHPNYTAMCTFYNDYYNPLYIILCVILGCNLLSMLLMTCVVCTAGFVGCCLRD